MKSKSGWMNIGSGDVAGIYPGGSRLGWYNAGGGCPAGYIMGGGPNCRN